jgi:hypothetical protein
MKMNLLERLLMRALVKMVTKDAPPLDKQPER